MVFATVLLDDVVAEGEGEVMGFNGVAPVLMTRLRAPLI